MNKPPDQIGFSIDKNKTLQQPGNGPKYFIMTRTGSQDNLTSTSPFLIKKVIDNVCASEVDMCKKLRNGTLLIKTKNQQQSSKIIQITSLCPQILVEVTEHNSLNYTKAVMYSNELRGIDEKEILEELKPQNVCELKKILKQVDGQLKETGLMIISFATLELPDSINIGYEKIRLRPYIPLPLKCKNCQRFGHSAKYCRSQQLCANCSGLFHTDAENNEKCTLPGNCINCTIANNEQNNHMPSDKKCPTFLKEKEIQAIITLEKKDRKTAHEVYNARHQLPNATYAAIAKTSSIQTPTFLLPKTTATTSLQQRPTVTYADLISNVETVSTKSTVKADMPSNDKITTGAKPKNSLSKTNTIILPRNTSRRSKLQLAAKLSKKQQGTKPKTTNDDINMDLDSNSSLDTDTDYNIFL